MEIKIQSLDHIHEAAREFIAAMGDNTVLLSMERWEPVKLLSSKHFVRNWVLKMSLHHPPLPLSTSIVRT